MCSLKLDIDATYLFNLFSVYLRDLQGNNIQNLPEDVFSGLGSLLGL